MLECPNRLATLAIETPAKSSSDAWVWRKPWIEIIGTPAFLQWRARRSLTVELYTFPFTKIGLSSGKLFKSSAN